MSSNETNCQQQQQQPPVPPPPLQSADNNKNTFANRKTTEFSECKWAAAYPEIQKACYLARVCSIFPPKAGRYKEIDGILQEGPTCGLTALCMLSDGRLAPKNLLAEAQHKQYTINGEMFSAKYLFELVQWVFASTDQQHVITTRLYEGKLSDSTIKQVLQNGGCLLVPYDPDFNHGPCLKNGRKAHWALIIGYLIDDNNKFFVFSRHGKTKNIAIWPLKSLCQSNGNLNEFEQPKGYPDAEFLIPLGGLGGDMGLKSKCIIVEGIGAKEIIIK